MPYNIPVINELVKLNYQVHVFRWTENCLTPYIPPELPNVIYYNRSLWEYSTLLEKTKEIQPLLIWVAGWTDKTYCKVVGTYRKGKNIPVIAGSDTQWKGGKQWFNVLFSPFRHKCYFSHLMIAGLCQYEYARRLGFSQCLQPFYSADISIFHQVDIRKKINSYPKNLLFVGRFTEKKGLSYLLEAWKLISDKNGWRLILIGNGPLKDTLQGYPNVIVKDFMSQDKIVEEMQNAGAFILPSVEESWGLVLHEAAAAGLPILASKCCGAVPYFVLHNYNGYTFFPEKLRDIQDSIEKLIDTSDEKLIQMSYKSRDLSRRINPEIVAKALLSVL